MLLELEVHVDEARGGGCGRGDGRRGHHLRLDLLDPVVRLVHVLLEQLGPVRLEERLALLLELVLELVPLALQAVHLVLHGRRHLRLRVAQRVQLRLQFVEALAVRCEFALERLVLVEFGAQVLPSHVALVVRRLLLVRQPLLELHAARALIIPMYCILHSLTNTDERKTSAQ